MKLLLAFLVSILCYGTICFADEEIIIDRNNIRIVIEQVEIITREDLVEERAELVSRIREIDRQLGRLDEENN